MELADKQSKWIWYLEKYIVVLAAIDYGFIPRFSTIEAKDIDVMD